MIRKSGNIVAMAGACLLVQLMTFACAGSEVWTWGKNSCGELGDGTIIDRVSPVLSIGTTNVRNIACTHWRGTWTDGGSMFAIQADGGKARSWGYNDSGQLGNGSSAPSGQPGSKVAVDVLDLQGCVQLSSGHQHVLALASDGRVWAWGSNSYGELGMGDTMSRNTPVQIPGLLNVASVAAGSSVSYAVMKDGTVKSWGQGWAATPAVFTNLSGVAEIACGYFTVYFLMTNGTVKAMGGNYSGQIGDGTTIGRPSPVPVTGLTNVVAVAGGLYHAVALLGDGTVKAWGRNMSGEVGDGTSGSNRLTPVPVSGLSGVTAISAGYAHSMALLNNGTVKTWGKNELGEIGDGSSGNTRLTAVTVPGLTNVRAISAGFKCSMALVTPGDGNSCPMTFAGAASTIYLPSLADLHGEIVDDGRPTPPATVTAAWSKVSGPGTVTFGNSATLVTTASFSQPGVYVLRLTGSDSVLSSSNTVTVTANGLTTAIPGDINGDGIVNVDDLNIVIQNFGRDH